MGNFSRNTFDEIKHYVGIRLQQGVPLVDADWNEQEDIRKYELRAFLKWFIGNGIPANNDGFHILPIEGDFTNFRINSGRCLVEGWDVINEKDMTYKNQLLYNNKTLAEKMGIAELKKLNKPDGERTDTVYLDVWEREVNADEDYDHLINPAIGIETCVRIKREWVVRVVEGSTTLPECLQGHEFYPLASLNYQKSEDGIITLKITDLRRTSLNLADLKVEIADARGNREKLALRLNESLDEKGSLKPDIVDNLQIKEDAAIEEKKILFSPAGHDHSGDSMGKRISFESLDDDLKSRLEYIESALSAHNERLTILEENQPEDEPSTPSSDENIPATD